MPADNHVTATGWLVSDPKLSDSNRPSSMRISSYCTGSKAKDNIRKVFLTVKTFDHDLINVLAKGMKVKVDGRFDTWDDKEGHQVIELMVEPNYDPSHGIVLVQEDGDGPPPRRQATAQLPPMTKEEVF